MKSKVLERIILVDSNAFDRTARIYKEALQSKPSINSRKSRGSTRQLRYFNSLQGLVTTLLVWDELKEMATIIEEKTNYSLREGDGDDEINKKRKSAARYLDDLRRELTLLNQRAIFPDRDFKGIRRDAYSRLLGYLESINPEDHTDNDLIATAFTLVSEERKVYLLTDDKRIHRNFRKVARIFDKKSNLNYLRTQELHLLG